MAQLTVVGWWWWWGGGEGVGLYLDVSLPISVLDTRQAVGYRCSLQRGTEEIDASVLSRTWRRTYVVVGGVCFTTMSASQSWYSITVMLISRSTLARGRRTPLKRCKRPRRRCQWRGGGSVNSRRKLGLGVAVESITVSKAFISLTATTRRRAAV